MGFSGVAETAEQLGADGSVARLVAAVKSAAYDAVVDYFAGEIEKAAAAALAMAAVAALAMAAVA